MSDVFIKCQTLFFMASKNYYRTHETMPVFVKEAIFDLSKKQGYARTRFKNYAIVVGTVYYQCMSIAGGIHNMHPISANYWKSILGKRYRDYINELLAEELIEESNYKNRNYYRIHANVTFQFSEQSRTVEDVPVDYNARPINNDEFTHISDRLANRIRKALSKITIDQSALNKDKRRGLVGRTLDEYRLDLDGFDDNMHMKGEVNYHHDVGKHYYLVKTLKKKKEELACDSFFVKDRVVLDNPLSFENKRKYAFFDHLNFALAKIDSGVFNIIRDADKTHRIFHPFVSLPSAILPYIKIEGSSIIGIDAKTSQFALTANLFNHFIETGDSISKKFRNKKVKKFIKDLFECYKKVSFNNERRSKIHVNDFSEDVLQKDFYEQLAELLGLTRDQAKIFCFSILFSKPTNTNEFKRKIEAKYPAVIQTLDLYKKEHKYQNLSINLQALESELFIDKIFNELYEKGILCFTRHDSVILKKEDAAKAKGIMYDIFASYGFQMQLKDELYKRKSSVRIEESLEEESEFFEEIDEELMEVIERYQENEFSLNYDDYCLLVEEGEKYLSKEDYNYLSERVIEYYKNQLQLDVKCLQIFNNIISNIYDQYNITI